MTCKILAAALAFSFACSRPVRAEAPSLLTEPPRKDAAINETITYAARDGYHFNLKAPQECGDSEAFDVSKKELKCKFSSAGEIAVSLKICDDKETACMFEDFTVLVKGAGNKQPAAAGAVVKDEGLGGFLLNDPGGALVRAQKEHALLFIDFFGRWCPPCRVMEDTVLTQPSFLEATRDMVRVSLDTDRPAAREWKRLFKPGGYPTYLVADADLQEIGRWTGSSNLSAFTAWIKDQERWKDQPIEKAIAAVASLEEAGKLRVARWYMTGSKWAEARGALSGLNTHAAAYLDAQAQVEENKSTDTVELTGLYCGLIDRFDGKDGLDAEGAVLDWTAALYKLNPAAAKPYIAGLDALIERLKVSKDAVNEGYDYTDVLYQAAVDMDDAGLEDLSKDLYGRAAQAYSDMAVASARADQAKGLRMSQARCLMGAKRYKEAATVYGGLTAKFPEEYAFHRSYSGALLTMKDYPEALKEAGLAARLSYGDIHSSIMVLKAKIELAQKDKAAAIKTLNAALAELAAAGGGARGAESDLRELLKKAEALN